MIGLVVAWTIAFTSTMAAQCSPPTNFWEQFEIDYATHGCINVQMFYEALAYSDLILDVLVLILPIPTVLSLKMPWKQKIAVLDILLLGSMYVFVSEKKNPTRLVLTLPVFLDLESHGSPRFCKSLTRPLMTPWDSSTTLCVSPSVYPGPRISVSDTCIQGGLQGRSSGSSPRMLLLSSELAFPL
jgi:hypothetical protein